MTFIYNHKILIFIDNGSVIDEKEILGHSRMYLSTYKIPREMEFTETMNS